VKRLANKVEMKAEKWLHEAKKKKMKHFWGWKGIREKRKRKGVY